VIVALPAMGRGFGGGMTDLQWVVDGYIVMFAVLLLARTACSPRRTAPFACRAARSVPGRRGCW
jgi:NaMN:DMB phosphoribosyltransferase